MKLTFLVFRNILEGKGRAILIILSIMISGSLFYASFTIKDSLTETYKKIEKDVKGYSDIIITAGVNNDSQQYFINPLKNSNYTQYEYVVDEILSQGVFRYGNTSYWFNVHGLNNADLDKISKFTISKDKSSFSGYKVIISKQMAENCKLSIGDKILLSINGNRHEFEVFDLAEKEGYFAEEATSEAIIIPIDTSRELLSINGKMSNQIHIKLKDESLMEDTLNKLSQSNPRLKIQRTVDSKDMPSNFNMYSMIFLIVSVIASIMSLYIVFMNFKVLSLDRLEFTGVMRSIGASRKASALLVIMESAVLGGIGGVLAVVLGIALQIFMHFVIMGGKGSFTIHSLVMIVTIAMTVVLAAIGAFIPVIRITRYSVNTIIRKNYEDKKESLGILRFIFGLSLMLISFGLVKLPYTSNNLFYILISILAVFVGSILFIPFLARFIGYLEIKFIKLIFGNLGEITLLNIKNDKEHLSVIQFCSIGVAILITILSVGKAIPEMTKEVYKMYQSDIAMFTDKMDSSFVEGIKKVDGVTDIYANYLIWSVPVNGTDVSIQMIDSVDLEKHNLFFKYEGMDNAEDLYKELNKGKNIIISSVAAQKLGKKEGDMIELQFQKNTVSYEIIGIVDISLNSGLYALLSKDNMIQDAGSNYFNRIYIKTNNDPDKVIEKIKDIYWDKDLWITTTNERLKASLLSSKQVFTIIFVFFSLCFIVGAVGIINNMAVSFYKRKKEIGIIFTVGMSRRDGVKSMFIEALYLAICSGILGALIGTCLLAIIPSVFKVINYPPIYLKIQALNYLLCIAGLCIFIAVTILGNIVRINKINMVEAIKENF